MKKITSIICLVFAFIMVLSLPVSASSPYQTYTYSISGTALSSPDAYSPTKTINSEYMGLLDVNVLKKVYAKTQPDLTAAEIEKKAMAISDFSDIQVDEDKNIYIADAKNNRIIVLDSYYKLKFILDDFINENGVPDGFNNPKGVFVTNDDTSGNETSVGRIFVCDTDNSRIVTFDRKTGKFLSVIDKPESQLFGTNAKYLPVALAVDKYNRMYVVSNSTTDGIIVMTDDGDFTGFIGAQKVVISLWQRIWKNFQTDEQKAMTEEVIPTIFNNIALSGEFIYATISSAKYTSQIQSDIASKDKSGDYAPVKLLNAAGDEIMRRNGFYPPVGEIDYGKTKVSDKISGISTIVDVAVGPEDTWSIIDRMRSKVFTYDYEGNLLFAFGDQGDQLGNITLESLNAIVYQGTNMLLVDNSSKAFTVYQRTEYGNIIIDAIRNQNERRYDKAIEDWTEILKRNSNFDAAYIGIGNALYRNGQYEEAIESFKSAYDIINYSTAYKEIRKEWISKYIILIPIFVIAVCIGCSKFLKFAKKVNKKTAITKGKRTYGQELIYVFHLIFHPFDGFWDLKHEKRGSVRAAATILAMTIVAFYYQAIGSGYVLNPEGFYSSFFGVVLSVGLPIALWIIANWCLTTLFEGEGSLKDIFIASCYSLMPVVLIYIPVTIASNFIVESEIKMLSLLTTFAFIWVGLLIFFGMMVTHDYSMGKNILTTLGTILGMVCIMFVAILFTTLLGKLVSFVTNIITELQFRM